MNVDPPGERARSSAPQLLSSLFSPTLALLAALVFATALSDSRYRSKRPRSESHSAPSALASVDALQTADPLKTAYEACNPEDGGPRCTPSGRPGLALERLLGPRGGHDEFLFLAVTAKGGPWPEQSENRIRQRHAVVSALFAAGFHADQFRRLSVVRIPLSNGCGENGSMLVPFELFSRPTTAIGSGGGQWNRALVLWLDSLALGDSPLAVTHEALEAFRACSRVGGNADAFVLGPIDSDMLQAMLDECDWLESKKVSGAGWPLRVLSPYATAPLPHKRLRDEKEDTPLAVESDHLLLFRAIGRDPAIAKMLASELRARIPDLMSWALEQPGAPASRGVTRALADALRAIRFLPPPNDGKVRVAIIAEQDTEYGRAWRDLMMDATSDIERKLHFDFLPYIAAIDGQGLGAAAAAAGEDAPYTDGPGQVDYLQRLQGVLERDESYAAIGVFGSDVYDTLMILEALRPSFPDTLFFTIDLDARFMHSEHLPYTRNVIVASHLPLGTGDTPQFRDLYQHSAFRTLRHLLRNGPDVDCLAERLVMERRSGPHLYEIGAGRAIELNFPPTNLCKLRGEGFDGFVVELAGALFGREVHAASDGAPPPRPLPIKRLAFSVLVLLALIYLAGFAPRSDEDAGSWWRRGLAWLALVTASVLACLLLLHVVASIGASEPIEPLELFAGVSAWPAVLLRSLATVFAMGALLWIPRRLVRVHREIEEAFHLKPRAPVRMGRRPKLSLRTLRVEEAWRAACSRMRNAGLRGIRIARWLSVLDSRDGLPAQELWRRVGHWIRGSRWRWFRLSVYTLLGYIALGTFFQLSPVRSPVRGELSFLLERASMLGMVLAYLAVSFLVLEAHVLCWRLVSRLGAPESVKLPESALKATSERTPLTDEQADRTLRIRLVARLTREVDRLIYYPIVLVCVIVAARASVFDTWSWPPVLVGTLTFFFVLMVLCALSIRRIAERERSDVLAYLEKQQLEAVSDVPRSSSLAILRREIEGLRGGAFSPLVDHVLVRSAFFPLLAYGATLYAARLQGG